MAAPSISIGAVLGLLVGVFIGAYFIWKVLKEE